MAKTKKRERHQSVSIQIDEVAQSSGKEQCRKRQRQRVLAEFESTLQRRQTTIPVADVSPHELQASADVWHATYGTHVSRALVQQSGPSIMPEAIIGEDDRVRIRNTDEYPYSAICSLEITALTGRVFVGTGWLVDSTTLITAGHCVFLPEQGGWAKRVRVVPGRNGASTDQSFLATQMHSVRGWTEDGRRQEDYGAITIANDASEFGSLGCAVMDRENTLKNMYHVIGYSADKAIGTLWGHLRELREVRRETLLYDTDTYGGNSGCPVFCLDDDGDALVVGIHNYGDISGNTATRITEAVFENIDRWSE